MQVQDEIMRNTTPKYRAPEMLETYSNQPINEKVDIWALGCIISELIYGIHPFESAEKLAIINIQMNIPKNIIIDKNKYGDFLNLISSIFVFNPHMRPNSTTIYQNFQEYANNFNINLLSSIYENNNSVNLSTSLYNTENNIFKSISEKTFGNFNDENMKKFANNTKEMFFKVKDKAENIFTNIKKSTPNIKEKLTHNFIENNNNSVKSNSSHYLQSNNSNLYQNNSSNKIKFQTPFEFCSKIYFIPPKFNSNDLVNHLNETNKIKQILIVSLFNERPTYFQQLKPQVYFYLIFYLIRFLKFL